ncbi:MAG: bifunctional (p)ppGpp synthetase/guanosine-3',5'-bis(diphosphate) 3'-pyrophosphohydrolase, partial [Solirubrobacterales bacterium]|nr:bifunctional (p)ppGpp synthetase/guanosine-3',5'-bis(diphosphate) 3'-pyrophosphohydrolase [Solirubrobacterales bacterium]
MVGSPLLQEIITELGFRKGEDFYVSIGGGKTSAQMVVNKILNRLKAGEAMSDERAAEPSRGRKPISAQASSDMGIEVDGLADVLVRLAKCCKPVPGDDILGYISLGRGITIHRSDCPNARALLKNPERFTPVSWSGTNQHGFRVEVAVTASDRPRLLEDLSRVFGEHGVNIISANCAMENLIVEDRFVVDVGDIDTLKTTINALRNVESVFDAYR